MASSRIVRSGRIAEAQGALPILARPTCPNCIAHGLAIKPETPREPTVVKRRPQPLGGSESARSMHLTPQRRTLRISRHGQREFDPPALRQV